MSSYIQINRRDNLKTRAQIIQTIRKFFITRNFLEVDTPIRIPAPAPEAHIDAIASEEWFLQTSPELYMKRLLATGYTLIFQICKCFRKAERGRRHLPELTMLEWYTAGYTYVDLMQQTAELIGLIAGQLNVGDTITYQGFQINLETPWSRLTVSEAFAKYASVSMEIALEKGSFDEVMVEEIEPRLGLENPVFIYDYPASQAALAILKPGDKSVAERFELYIGGLELCNGFTELTDPDEQHKRFEQERNFRKSTGKRVYPLPQKFLNALTDMPDAAGNALGIDRLVMLFTDTATIDEVVAFTPEEL